MALRTDFTATQKRALAVATVLAIVLGTYFLRSYLMVVVVAAVAAYLFNPLYRWFGRRCGNGLSLTLTILSALVALVIPLGLVILLAAGQINVMIRSVSDWVAHTDLSALGDRALRLVNEALDRVPFLAGVDVTPAMIQERLSTVAQRAGEWALGVLTGFAGGVAGGLTAAVLFVYVFASLLSNQDGVRTLIRKLNPLGEDVTDLYLEKMAAMVRGAVFGQFAIAVAQGVAGAVSIYLAGFHQGFFIFAVLLTVLSVIPLGGGIVSIPFGIGMMLFGNVWGGPFVIVWHVLVVTNIDNVLRPILVPRQARLDSALMLLAVFSGIGVFGFLGIVIGPVLMIVIVTTISVYLAVFKGIPILDPEEDDQPDAPGRFARFARWVRTRAGADEATARLRARQDRVTAPPDDSADSDDPMGPPASSPAADAR